MTIWIKQKLGDYIIPFNGKAVKANEIGMYPVYGSNGKIGYTDIFNYEDAVILGRVGAYCGSVSIEKNKFWASDNTIVIKNNEKSDLNFIYYLLKNLNINQYAGGAAQPLITHGLLKQIQVSILDKISQSQIATILKVYDDLFENNEKRIKILEEMAQRLYTEWFVKFKFPGHENAEMVDSGTVYGEIPQGWEEVPMIELADFINGYPFKPSQLGTVGLPIIKIPELRSGILEKTPRNSGENIPEKYLVKNGDILFSWSATLLVNIWNCNVALLNQHLFNVIPKNDIYKTYTYFRLKQLVYELEKQVVGATMQHLRRGTIVDAKVLLPPQTILVKFENIAGNLIKLVGNLNMQNNNLEIIRDLLISQLVTGRRDLKI